MTDVQGANKTPVAVRWTLGNRKGSESLRSLFRL